MFELWQLLMWEQVKVNDEYANGMVAGTVYPASETCPVTLKIVSTHNANTWLTVKYVASGPGVLPGFSQPRWAILAPGGDTNLWLQNVCFKKANTFVAVDYYAFPTPDVPLQWSPGLWNLYEVLVTAFTPFTLAHIAHDVQREADYLTLERFSAYMVASPTVRTLLHCVSKLRVLFEIFTVKCGVEALVGAASDRTFLPQMKLALGELQQFHAFNVRAAVSCICC
jgi:hypothetical protein